MAQLGRGGMGIVWRALDEVLHREVAVKELRTFSDAAPPELANLGLRMQREARAAARVRHTGVVAVHDVAQVDGRPLIVMELVDGPSLDDIQRERGTLDAREVAGIGAKVMDALSAAHRVGELHRDVKPGNILLDRSVRVVLTDFGIATMEDPGDGSATHLTRSGELVGSLDYLAPERAQGHDPGPASDIWALGATLYAAVEGTSPFRRTSTWSTLTAIVAEPLPEPPRAGPLGPVLRQLMDKQPESRPTADEACRLLQAVADSTERDSATRGSRAPAPRPRETTERSVPAVWPGFGPPEPGAAGFGPAGTDGSGAGQSNGSGIGVPVAGQAGFGAPDQSEAGTGVAGTGTGTGSGEPAFGAAGAGGFGPGAQAASSPGSATPTPGGGTGVSAATLISPSESASVSAPASVSASAGSGSEPGFPTVDDGTAPGAQQPAGHGPVAGGSSVTTSVAQSSAPRRKGRTLLAAAAVTVVLAATGVTVAFLNGFGTEQGDKVESATPSGEQERAEDTTPKPTNGATGDDGSDDTPDGDDPSPAPVCEAVGGGKYNCEVWKTATSYTAAGAEVGTLNAGTNYFYCQRNLGRRETYGEWTNVWWAQTDDDSGNTDVFVSDVYIKGGDNDAPLPGLPVC
ncbi:serine/threonine-protein kinase [Streptomyces sp. NBC_00878]|uniref:serine/threonine-protein kinase n=1 Tax=Streptomyces sp. NBC_00878 TaxID=2975854 RepID=UPI00224D142C|nr:serine/threonine-protein kinase [Streptomyces sp. NBC_00878]MCX4910934.1 serine/threonine protein kinase [Streptomyces sp. NBC_00878]